MSGKKMEADNLHEKTRKELKQLCAEHNIRTAGVKVTFCIFLVGRVVMSLEFVFGIGVWYWLWQGQRSVS